MDTSNLHLLAQTQKWRKGSTWEFDMYIVELFVQAMAYGEYPAKISYFQPVLDDEFLNTSLNDNVVEPYKSFFSSPDSIQELLKKQNAIITAGNTLLEKMRANIGIFDFDEYRIVQTDLSLLMASVSVVFDPLLAKHIEHLSEKMNLTEEELNKYVIQMSSVTALNKSNKLLLEIYHSNETSFEDYYTNGKKLSNEIIDQFDKHSEVFGWINTGEKGRPPWNSTDFLNQLKDLRLAESILHTKLSEHDAIEIQPVIELNINDNVAADLQIELDFYFQKYLQGVLRDSYDERIVEKLTLSELKDIVGGKQINLFRERLYQHSLVFADEGKAHVLWFGDATYAEIRSWIIVETYDESNIKLIGRSASSGLVEGIARIVRTQQDLENFPNGHILVAEKTQPSYILAMRKAIAIVTDVGGITSHAAIVSRELNTPCVVATGNATNAIRDGDRIRVDAKNGVIEILERARA